MTTGRCHYFPLFVCCLFGVICVKKIGAFGANEIERAGAGVHNHVGGYEEGDNENLTCAMNE
jgi:hypothetical protein